MCVAATTDGGTDFHGLRREEPNVGVRVRLELLQSGFKLALNRGRIENGSDLLQRFRDVESNVGHRIVGRRQHDRKEMFGGQVSAAGLGQDVDAKETRHAVEIIRIARHGQDLGNDGGLGPVRAELFHQLLEIGRRRFPAKMSKIIEQQTDERLSTST